ncbi:nucleotidyltransferase family protein [Pararoseomonas indoligenes]|uniref:Nucleotidyltransferase family protein n=1 Tax=Roseomonas indoligenes TaxID=2820811 RepID=A0A940N4H6_9PROT|nr:nucleotidyltransferase family protein [Pararoseomonas indoligenes]MBP0495020.1 nucleotidyltransferase family protein [Pararoseomonas indoligenes]
MPLIPDRDRWLLEACLRPPSEARAAFAAWRDFADPAEMEGRDLRLMPLLHANLRRAGVKDPKLAWLGGQAKHIWLTGALRLRSLQQGLCTLEAAGIPVVLMKGAALLARWRAEAELRPMGDFDLLLPRERLRDALGALQADGWGGPAPATVTETDLRRFHALGVPGPSTSLLDLHWRPAAAIGDPAHAEGVMSRAVGGTLNGMPLRIAGLTDHLFVLLAHAFHDTVIGRHDWVAEAALLLRHGGEGTWDWPLLRGLSRRYRLEAWTSEALALVADIALLPLPRGVSSLPRWRLPFQNWELTRRGRETESPLAALARRHGGAARGLISAGPSQPPRERPASALRRVLRQAGPLADFAELRSEGFNAGQDHGGGSFVQGWSVPEPMGRWTDGDTALLVLRCLGRPGERLPLRMTLVPHVPEGAPGLAVSIWAGGEVVSRRGTELLPAPFAFHLEGALHAWRGEAILPVWFRFEGLPSIRNRVRHDWDRALGVFLQRIDAAMPEAFPVLDGVVAVASPRAAVAAWSGWGDPEPYGRWTIGNEAQFHLRLPDAGVLPGRLRLEFVCAFAPDASGQAVGVLLDGAPMTRFVLSGAGATAAPGPVPGGRLDIPLPPGLRHGVPLIVRLRPERPTSPLSVGFSNDPRPLGVMLGRIVPLP